MRRSLLAPAALVALLLVATPAPVRDVYTFLSSPLSAALFRQAVLAAMDPKADPCQDFYRYACGGWLDRTELPATEVRWMRGLSDLRARNTKVIRALLEDAAASPGPPGSERQKIGDLYAGCLDSLTIAERGTAPLAPWLALADSVRDPASLLRAAGELARADVQVLFAVGVVPDFKQPTTNLFYMSQGGLGLPDRDYYVSDDPKKKAILAAYEKHVANLLGMLGASAEDAAAEAAQVVAFESALARASRSRSEMRDPDKRYHKLDREGLAALTPTLPWAAYFEALGQPGLSAINVAVPEFYQALERILAETPPATWRAYLRWQVVHQSVFLLPERFRQEDFAFYDKTLSGQAEMESRRSLCTGVVNALLGEAVGKLYVEREFPGLSKEIVLEMIADIEAAFEANLPALAWMDDTTRARAIEKARKVATKIGYPDSWCDYSPVAVRRDDFFASATSAARFEVARQLARVGQPVDRGEWLMTPQTVNAYYLATANEIGIPAGILRPPFFHRDYPAAMNYGALGAVIGHELIHGFDDDGRKSDGDGVLREWWEPAAAARFEAAARCVEEQFSRLEVEPGVRVDGKLTLGEDLADLGGLGLAYAAYKSWERRHGAPEPAVPGLTNDQLFFVASAQVGCAVATPEYLRQQVTVNFHAPARFRAIGAVMNSRAFRTAFACEAGEPMVADPTCTVW